jgi:hypothetical protein
MIVAMAASTDAWSDTSISTVRRSTPFDAANSPASATAGTLRPVVARIPA